MSPGGRRHAVDDIQTIIIFLEVLIVEALEFHVSNVCKVIFEAINMRLC